MASQEFLASFAVEIDEAGVSRLQQVLEENRDLANDVAAAFEAATAAIREYQKAALGGDNPSGEGNRDDGSGKNRGVTDQGEDQSELAALLRNYRFEDQNDEDFIPYLEEVKQQLPDISQGIRDMADQNEKPEPSTSESGEGEGLEGSLDLEGARGDLEAFREEAAQPVALSGNASGIVSAAGAALASVKSMFSQPLTITAKVETESGGDDGGPTLKMSAGGRFSRPTDVQVAEDGDAEYIIPVKKESRAVPLVRQLLAELSPAARASLSLGDNASSLITTGLAAGQPAGAQITQNNSNVSAPVTIQVRSTGADAEQVGRSLYDTAER
ncbi:MAG: hypothetical protein IJI09_09010 [Clostridia bacterium]|nr:hypothetical protein [Clostridia bacterium]